MNFCVCHMYVGPVEAGRRYQLPGAEVTGDCELTDVGDGTQTQVPCKSS